MNKNFIPLAALSLLMLWPISAQQAENELTKVQKDRERLIDLALRLESDFGRTLQDFTELQKDYAKLLNKKAAPDQSANVKDLQNKLKQALAKLAEKTPAGSDPHTQKLLKQDMVNLRNELHRERQDLLVARARLIRANELETKLNEANTGRTQATKELQQIKAEHAKLLGELKATVAKLKKAEQGHKIAIAKIDALQTENLSLKAKVKTQDVEIARLLPIEDQYHKAIVVASELKKEQSRLSKMLTEREKQLTNLKSHLATEVKRSLEIPILVQAKTELEKKLAASSVSNAELKKNNEILSAERLELEKKINETKKNIAAMRTQIEKNEKAMASVTKVNAMNVRLVAEQALLQNTVDMAKAELVKAMGLRNRLEAELAESKKIAATAKALKNKNAALIESQAMIQDRLMASEKSFNLLKADRDRLDASYNDLEKAKADLATEITRRNDELEKLRAELVEKSKNSGDVVALREEKATLEAQLMKRDEDLKKARKELGKLQINATVLERQLVSLKRTTTTINPIRYAKGDANVTNQQTRVLNEVQQVLKIFPNASFEIVGHTCDLGIAEQNIDLSQRRAKSLHDFLLSKGIKEDRLKHRGMGQSEPAVPNTNEANRRQNRRVEVEILD
ncbi:MAG: OmpA family protein [Akkermansiaceae bacterium]|nr:OmpA family protein [Akkermansiaceae bacterium]